MTANLILAPVLACSLQLVAPDPTVAVIAGDINNQWGHVTYMAESQARLQVTQLESQAALTASQGNQLAALKLAIAQVEGIREAWVFPCPGNCRQQPDSPPNFK